MNAAGKFAVVESTDTDDRVDLFVVRQIFLDSYKDATAEMKRKVQYADTASEEEANRLRGDRRHHTCAQLNDTTDYNDVFVAASGTHF